MWLLSIAYEDKVILNSEKKIFYCMERYIQYLKVKKKN